MEMVPILTSSPSTTNGNQNPIAGTFILYTKVYCKVIIEVMSMCRLIIGREHSIIVHSKAPKYYVDRNNIYTNVWIYCPWQCQVDRSYITVCNIVASRKYPRENIPSRVYAEAELQKICVTEHFWLGLAWGWTW